MSHPTRFLVLAGVLVMLGGCSDTASTAPAADANPSLKAISKPTREPLFVPPFVLPAGEACSFAVAGDVVVNKEFAKTFPPKPNGDVVQLITGRFVARYTNVATGKSITVNISGPARFTFHADGSLTLESRGRTGNAGFPTPGESFLLSGRFVVEITPDGVATLVSLKGHEEDLCAALS